MHSTLMNTTAADVQPGDVWLGQSEVVIDAIEAGDVLVLPENPFAASSPQVEIQMVRIVGRIVTGRDRSTKLMRWSLRPDQEMEVRRG